MSNKKDKPKLEENVNVEFGMEFGDLNNAKLYEIPYANDKKSIKKQK